MAEIYVKVEPDENEFRIEEGTYPRIHLESEAEAGKANAELLRELERILGEKPGIVSGHRSRRKKIRVSMGEEEALEKIEAETDG